MQEKLTTLGYRVILAIMISLIIITGLAGVIRVKTKVIPATDMSHTTVERVMKSAPSVNGLYYLFVLDEAGGVIPQTTKMRVPHNLEGLQKLLETLLKWEKAQDSHVVTFIPQNVSIINMYINGDVLFIDFSEEFQFNTWGSQGYIGQLEQILRTVASVSMVRYLQIHINGERIDFLHEGVYIGRPIDLWAYKEK
ncbi:GerMN domain-containing protein [Entomospira nematocerorum]|uniref:GerMN domain-containing protein n=1 Tax=Entomospira nematocerorum TaxID=2719987 RepID=A0A968KSD8_9SPIO|nr:GerMN domain-containing protein [Entomospira nematocera]NIZ46440.1 hypothetical protein [Entomospira nematocera]WDI33757.1 GerMN domain-containing protein [Entomospira nematocera]